MRDGGVAADQLVAGGTSRQQAEFHVIPQVNDLGTGGVQKYGQGTASAKWSTGERGCELWVLRRS
jgi:hypothetical protein